MLKIDHRAFENAIKALMIAAASAKDQAGLKVHADTPREARRGTGSSDVNPIRDHDWQRISAITLGAIVALVNGPAHVNDEHHFTEDEVNGLNIAAAARRLGPSHY